MKIGILSHHENIFKDQTPEQTLGACSDGSYNLSTRASRKQLHDGIKTGRKAVLSEDYYTINEGDVASGKAINTDPACRQCRNFTCRLCPNSAEKQAKNGKSFFGAKERY